MGHFALTNETEHLRVPYPTAFKPQFIALSKLKLITPSGLQNPLACNDQLPHIRSPKLLMGLRGDVIMKDSYTSPSLMKRSALCHVYFILSQNLVFIFLSFYFLKLSFCSFCSLKARRRSVMFR